MLLTALAKFHAVSADSNRADRDIGKFHKELTAFAPLFVCKRPHSFFGRNPPPPKEEMPRLEESVEVEDAGRRISLDELIEDLERTEARMLRRRTTDGHAAAAAAGECDDSISAASAIGISASGGEQDDQENDGALDRTHDTTSMSSTSRDNEAHYCDDNDIDIELGSDAGPDADADANADGDGGTQKHLGPDDGQGPKGAESNGDNKISQKKDKTHDDRRRNTLVLIVAILAIVGIAVGLGLFVKGVTGLSSNKSKAPEAAASADPGSVSDVAPVPTSSASSPVSSPTPPATESADELSIYQQFGVEEPQEEAAKEEESSETLVSAEESGAISSTTPKLPTAFPTRSPTSASPTLASMPDPTIITASPTSLPTRSPSQQTIVPEAASPTAPQLPPSITTKFSMHITMQDVNADFFDNRSAFGKAIFANTFGLFRRVVFTANNNNDAYNLWAQGMRAGYDWNSDCDPSIGDGCPPDTVVVATFTGTSALESAGPSISELGSFDEVVENAFAYTVLSSDALATWVSNVKDQGIRVTSTALYLNDEKLASYSM